MLSDADRLKAHELYARYAYAFDSNAADEWASLFTDDGEFRLGEDRVIGGRTALRDFALERNGSAPGVSHHTTNVLVEEVEPDVLAGRAYVLALRVDGAAVRIRNLGVYADESEHTGRIRVHIVDPGATRTRMRQLAFPGEEPESVKPPEVVAEFVLKRVLSDAPSGELVRAPDA